MAILFNGLDFKAMQSSLDALSLKQKVISNNLANIETPGFKASKVTFEDALENARNEKNAEKYNFQAKITKDETTSARPDGNNVSVDKEQLELYNTYLQSVYLYQKISSQMTDMQYVLGQAFK